MAIEIVDLPINSMVIFHSSGFERQSVFQKKQSPSDGCVVHEKMMDELVFIAFFFHMEVQVNLSLQGLTLL